MGKEERRAFDEALTSMDSLSAESKLSVANLSTSVTFQVNHSSLPKMAFGRNILKNFWLTLYLGQNFIP